MTSTARIERLRAAGDEFADLDDRLGERSEARVRETVEAYHTFVGLLDSYEDRATGSGFEEYIEFQEAVADLVDDLPEDLLARDAFEAADDAVHQRRLSASDFDHAREVLSPAREYADLLDEWERAREELRDARREVSRRIDDLDERIAHLERVRELGEADLDAPTGRLRDPVEAYDDAVREAFDAFRRQASAREVLRVVRAAEAFPLVGFQAPPDRLREYVFSAPAGEESLPTLLEYADYSTSKLDHYVDDPAALKRHVAPNRTYLTDLDAGPLTVGWPPPPAGELRHLTREYEAVCHRFAPADVTEKIRAVRALPRATDYERLHRAAAARAELTDGERELLASDAVAEELASARRERERLREALDAAPEP